MCVCVSWYVSSLLLHKFVLCSRVKIGKVSVKQTTHSFLLPYEKLRLQLIVVEVHVEHIN